MSAFGTGVAIATALYKRAAESPVSLYKRAFENQPDVAQYELPGWSWIVVLANLIVFFPVIIVVCPVASHPFASNAHSAATDVLHLPAGLSYPRYA